MNKWKRPNYMPCLPLGDNQSRITECGEHRQLSRRAAAEGTVLLKNENALLPFKKGTKIAVFGKGQIDYVKGGGGSGDVTVSYVRNIYQGLKMKAEYLEVFEPLSLYYQEYVAKEYKNGTIPGMIKEIIVPSDLFARAKEFTDTAVIVIGRYSGEGWDRKNDGTDDYFNLCQAELDLIEKVTTNFDHVTVLLNVGAVMDVSWFVDNDKISSAVIVWQGGMEGGLAVADVLTGEVNPSGKLADTCAKLLDDYPSAEGFHESDDYVKYTEDVFVGYRYFETVPGKKERVVYPFGYGLSYTTFQFSDINACSNGKCIMVTLNVTNTGDRAGKEVAQIYYRAPEGRLSKPARILCGFKKTKELMPGESQEICISFAIKEMASFDDTGVTAKSCYVLEKGIYRIYVGTDVRNAKEIDYTYKLDETIITQTLHSYCAPERLDKRMKADGSYEILECRSVKRAEFSCNYKSAEKPEEKHELTHVAEEKIDLDTFIAQMTNEELCQLVTGQPSRGVANTGGMGAIERLGIPAVMTVDGPAGVRIQKECEVKTTAFPVATALAASWNLELMEAIGQAGALEVKENNISIWLTPALNIHRSPLCGRNFEYYSEDPFLSGKMAAAAVRGIQSQNIVATPKHFACNNKETNRKESDSILSERALREIYLKGFEICVKEARPKMIMTAYNIINGVRASENAELLAGILREEWGYEGMITSDWRTHGNHEQEIKAGNDIKMPVGTPEELLDALKAGRLKREEICACARRILEMILWLD
ncbi:MAG: glycoside hydrolase family 3 C-terminal domain-containing protein [Lachnospiraceae bacterium]|nr:glycoside hydrolase family 3 C-terminal domain-containing protein [Lachnospiraceae bacterium]